MNIELNKEFLHDYLNTNSPVGQEAEAQKVWIDYIKHYVDVIETDAYGNAVAKILSKSQTAAGIPTEKRKKLVIDSHCDEISFKVVHISDGLIRVVKNGGVDAMIAPGTRVNILTNKGIVRGVFGQIAIHLRHGSTDKAPKLEDLYIDLGVDTNEAVKELGVRIGDNCVSESKFEELGNYFVGKSLDDKISGYATAELARYIKETNVSLDYDLYIANTVAEEVGLFGSFMIALNQKPDAAISIDVTHSTNSPGISSNKEGSMKSGLGPTIDRSAQNHRVLSDLFIDVCEQSEIPYQLSDGSFGNNSVSYYKVGCPTQSISIPLKYMHTQVEMVASKDIETLIQMFLEVLPKIKIEDLRYHKQFITN
jgi:putative aminopeptidase FrvX